MQGKVLWLTLVVLAIQVVCVTQCVNGTGSTIGLRSYLADLQQEFDKLDCMSAKLSKGIDFLTSSNILTNQIQTRTKQLTKILVAQQSLALEIRLINSTCTKFSNENCSGYAITGDDASGRRYIDNSYARSCKDYKFPSTGYFYEGSIGNGYYWIKPDPALNATIIKVYCEMNASGGGWTALTSDVIASSLNTGSQSRMYLYAKDSGNWVKTPSTTLVWNPAIYQGLSGTYTTYNGVSNSFSCTSVSDGSPKGIGCSNGSSSNKATCGGFTAPNYCNSFYMYPIVWGTSANDVSGTIGIYIY